MWKSMETVEQTLSEMVGCRDFDTTRFIVEEDRAALALSNSHMGRDSDTLLLKQKNDRIAQASFRDGESSNAGGAAPTPGTLLRTASYPTSPRSSASPTS